MLSIIVFLLIHIAHTQYTSYQQQYPSNNYNSWFSNSQNNQPWIQETQQNRAYVYGNLISDDGSILPYGSQVIVTIQDVSIQDIAASPLNSFVATGFYQFPIRYQIPYSMAQIAQDSNAARRYTLQARIEKNGQKLYISDTNNPVQLVPRPMYPINIMMKRINPSIYPEPVTAIQPTIGSIYACQLRPETGSCYGNILQYYYNTQLRFCQTFMWGGCGGNQNRFSSRDECERRCASYRRRSLNTNAKQTAIG